MCSSYSFPQGYYCVATNKTNLINPWTNNGVMAVLPKLNLNKIQLASPEYQFCQFLSILGLRSLK